MNPIKITSQPVVPSFPKAEAPKASAEEKTGFGEFLSNAIKGIDGLQTEAAEAQDMLVRGDAAELHQVMIAAEKAGISFDLLLEIRRKLLDAYQELMRMPM